VWIDFFSSSPGRAGDELRRMIADAEPFALTGVWSPKFSRPHAGSSRIEHYLSQWKCSNPWLPHYRKPPRFPAGSFQGVSLTTIDALIAAIASSIAPPCSL